MTRGQVNRTGAAGEEEEAVAAEVGRAAGGSRTGTKVPSGCSPSRRIERRDRPTVKGTGKIRERSGFRKMPDKGSIHTAIEKI